MKPGPKNLITDIPGLLVGNAQDDALKSGTTVVTSANPFVASVHVMGGAPGTRETDLLAPDKSVARVDALVLSGGSAFGLDACSGVMDALAVDGRGLDVAGFVVPIVPGAILFDLPNGGYKNWQVNPYRALGAQALKNARSEFALGTSGAGTGALTAMVKGGLGSTSVVLDNGCTVGAVVAVNSVGSVTTPGDRHFWAAPFEIDGEFGGLGPDPAAGLGAPQDSRKRRVFGSDTVERANTAIAVVGTDATLTKSQCKRVAVMAHDGVARATVPSHLPSDGDLVFALSTGGQELADPDRELGLIGHAASLCLARAIARAAYLATPAPGDLLPCWSQLNAKA